MYGSLNYDKGRSFNNFNFVLCQTIQFPLEDVLEEIYQVCKLGKYQKPSPAKKEQRKVLNKTDSFFIVFLFANDVKFFCDRVQVSGWEHH